MTVQVGCGPTWAIDGPPSQAPTHTLLGASRVVEDVTDDEVDRWVNGVQVYPDPPGPATVWDAEASGSDRVEKSYGASVPLPKFRSMVVYLGETCTAAGISGGGIDQDEAQRRFVARASRSLGAVESAAVEAEFMAGAVLGGVNPYLADGNADIVGSGAVKIAVAFALLENAIGESGKAGVIHCTPGAAALASFGMLFRDDRGPGGSPVLRTVNGTVVVPGYGYVGRKEQAGQSDAGAMQEWMYATGPVEVRRSRPILLPEDVSAAVDRKTNSLAYLVERYYVADWDTTLQAAVLADWTL